MLFSFKAIKKDGSHYESTLEAADKFALYKALHAEGATVISVSEKAAGEAGGLMKKLSTISFGGVKIVDKIMFAKNLSAMLKAGLPLARALAVLERQVETKKFKATIHAIEESLAKGQTFSQSLKAYPKIFSPLFISMVAAGEESGSLSDALKIVGDQLEKGHLLTKKVRGAMMYPGIILSVMVIIAVLMFVYIVPKLTATFRDFNVELPFATRLVIGTSDFLQNNFILFVLGVVILVAAFVLGMRTEKGKRILSAVSLKIPVIGKIIKEVNAARTARTLSSLLSSGVDVIGAVTITADVVQNRKYQDMLRAAVPEIERGVTLSEIFEKRTDIYPVFIGEMMAVGEETGTISKVLLEVAHFYEDEVEQKTKDMSTIIEPFLMVVIGLAVGFFALAMISPIYSLSENI